MRILQVISYGYLAGGAEQSVSLLKMHLTKLGHNVLVISSDHDQSSKHFSDIEFKEISASTTRLPTKLLRHMWYGGSYACVKKAVVEFKPDVVHFHTMGQLSPSAIHAIGTTPGILTVHGPEEYVRGLLEWAFQPKMFRDQTVTRSNLTALGKMHYLYHGYLQRPVYTRAFKTHIKLLIAPSKYMEAILLAENYGIEVRQVYNGIVLPKYSEPKNSNRLLYVGRLENVKGVDILLSAMENVVAKQPAIKLDIVGDGSARSDLEEFVRAHSLTECVTFVGWVNNAEALMRYSQSTAVVIPSTWPENFPTVCIEALAVGRPVVGSRTGGIPELVVDGKTGLLSTPGDVDELARAITKVLGIESVRVSKACSESVSEFAADIFVRHLLQAYRDVQVPEAKGG